MKHNTTRLHYLILILITVLTLLLFFGVFVQLKYDINFIEYAKYSLPYSHEELEYMKEKGYIIYSPDSNAPPLSYIDKTTGAYEGLIIDYMSSISIESGMTVVCNPLPWGKIFEKIKRGDVDTSDIYSTDKREEDFLFTQPIYSMAGSVVVTDKRFRALEDLAGCKVAVIKDDYAKEVLEDSSGGFVLVTVKNIEDGLDALESGGVDAIAGDAPVIDFLLNKRENKNSFYTLDETLFEKDVTFGVNKESEILLNILNKTILRLKKKDVLVKAQEKWFGVSSPVIKKGNSYDAALFASIAVLFLIVIIFFWNNTMKKKIKEKTMQLEVNEENLHTIINSLYTRLVVIDQNGKIIECNHAAQEELQASEDIIINSCISDYPLLDYLFILEIGDEKTHVSYGNRFFDVSKRKLLPLLENTLLSFEDVTDKTIYEKKMRQEVKMAAINHLSAGFAHEVRNPLGIIRNYLFILRNEVSSEKGLAALCAAEMAVNRINSLISNLLNLSKVEKDQLATIDLCALLENVVALEGKHLRDENIEITFVPECCPIIESNPESLKIIFLNLIENAVDAAMTSIKGGHIEQGIVHISINETDTQVVTEIRDNGIGIDPKNKELVFDAFFTTKDTGTGLGLYIVQNEIKKIGGNVEVESSPGCGTCFTVTIPRIH